MQGDRKQQRSSCHINDDIAENETGVYTNREIPPPETESESRANSIDGCGSFWAKAVRGIHSPVLRFLHLVTGISARNPKTAISAMVFISIVLLVVGLFANFELMVDERILYAPEDSKTFEHRSWINDRSGFPAEPRNFQIIVHADGGNVLGMEPVRRVFEALNALRDLPKYEMVCVKSNYIDPNTGYNTCKIHGVTHFWNHSAKVFADTISSDEEAIAAMSAPTFPDGTHVSEEDILGLPKRAVNGTLTFAYLYYIAVELPDLEETKHFERDALCVLIHQKRVEWRNELGNKIQLEAIATRSNADERDKIYSRTMLGFRGVVSVLLSIMAGYGLMFLSGVPFTNLTPLIPFVVFGIGVDDIFILSAGYEGTEKSKSVEDRVHDAIEKVGLSIFLTTATSTTAFGLGCLSTVPAMIWLCQYAATTVFLVLLYQLTFFVACIVLDERRIQGNKQDCCYRVKLPARVHFLCLSNERSQGTPVQYQNEPGDNRTYSPIATSEQLMYIFAKKMMHPYVKVLVVFFFAALTVACGFAASKLTPEFNYKDMLPSDSYVTAANNVLEDYSSRMGAIVPYVYFRKVDQSDGNIHKQMDKYISDLQAIEYFGVAPPFYWLNDFRAFNSSMNSSFLTFEETLDMFLLDQVFGLPHANDILRDKNGSILSSRTMMPFGKVELDEFQSVVNALQTQRRVTASQPINEEEKEWPFFTYCFIYDLWEFFSIMFDELFTMATMGVIAVTGLALLLIPHWTGSLFILPMIVMLYIDMLGVSQWAGIHIGPVFNFAVLLSIGLMVDYLMHVLFCYYECAGTRQEKAIGALRTIGASVMHGAFSTFLGTLPLAFSNTKILLTVFHAFLALTLLGGAHGLILLPVVLSIAGPEDISEE